MTHPELNRQWQLERANLIAHLSHTRSLLAQTQGMLQADRACDKAIGTNHLTRTGHELLGRIEAYLPVGMFDALPEEVTK